MNKSRSLAILAALVLSGAGQARADQWNGFFSDDWFSAGNWDGFDGPPGVTDEGSLPTNPWAVCEPTFSCRLVRQFEDS